MEPKNSKIFNKEIMQAVSAFCETQEIKDIDNFMYLCFKQGFDIRKYGLLGKTLNDGEKEVVKEVIVEKRVEIPVEVIKEVEKIVEVPVEMIKEVEKIVEIEKVVEVEKIVEVPVEVIKEVETIVQISDDTQINELLLKIEDLNGEISIKISEIDKIRQEFSTKTQEMENTFQNEMSKKDKELDEVRQKLDENIDISVTNNKLNMLQETLKNLRTELQQKNEKIKELEQINRDLLNGNTNQGYLLRGSNLNRRVI